MSHSRATVVVGLWAVVVAISLPFADRESDRLSSTGFDVPGSQSERVEKVLTQVAPNLRPSPLAVVLQAPSGTTRADWRAAVDRLTAAASTLDRVALDPVVRSATLRAFGDRIAVAPLTVARDDFHDVEVARALQERLHAGRVRTTVVGQGALWSALLDESRRDLRRAELVALPLVLLLLLVASRSLSAALLPLVLGAVAVVVGEALVFLLAQVAVTSVFVANLASMIGLGAAVDYALFLISRHRQELGAGRSRQDALAVAMRTAGRAVIASGLAVIVALGGLLFLGTAAIRSMAVGAMLLVAVAVIVATTLLPALVALVDLRPTAPPVRAPRPRPVLRRPVLTVVCSVAALGALAVPALALHTGDGALRQLPRDNVTRRATAAALDVAGPGRASPLKLLVSPTHVAQAVEAASTDQEVARTSIGTRTRDGRFVLITARARHAADSTEAKALVRRLRARLPDGSLVGGDSAAQVDFNQITVDRLWIVGLWVGLISALVLAWLLRSARLVLVALGANTLSLAAALGVLTLAFVRGSPGYVNTVVLPVVIAVTFGLSMDYQVFLLSRIRERLVAGDAPAVAVDDALAANGRTIATAAAIMVAVFAAFIATGVPAIREIGVGAAVAIILDATIVRLALLPAAVTLFARPQR